jgi:hypothetical protein
MDENPYQSPVSPPPAEKPTSTNRWRKIISATIFAVVAIMAPAWSWYPDKSAIAMLCLLAAALIRWCPPPNKGRSFRLTRSSKNP